MSAPVILLCVVIVLVLIGQIRVGCKAEYDQDGVQVFVRVAAFYIRVFPLKKKDKEKKLFSMGIRGSAAFITEVMDLPHIPCGTN